MIEHSQVLTQAVRRFEPTLQPIDQSILEFCQQRQINLQFFIEILQVFEKPERFNAGNFMVFPVPVIVDYLYRTHHYYLHNRLFEIEQTVVQLLRENQDSNPLVLLLSGFFKQFRKELIEHIALEEEQLFPYVSYLHACQNKGEKLAIPQSQFFSLKTFEAIHNDEEEVKLSLIREKIILQNPSTTESFSYKILLKQLEILETDMHIHGLIEDNVLLFKAFELENCQYN